MVDSLYGERLGEATSELQRRRNGPHREEIPGPSTMVGMKSSCGEQGRQQTASSEPLMGGGGGVLTEGPPGYTLG